MTSKKTISDEERAARRQAVEYAEASVKLEGFEITEASMALAKLFIDGEISLEEYLAAPYDEPTNGI